MCFNGWQDHRDKLNVPVMLPAEMADAQVSGAASNALCQLCEECGAKLALYLDTLMALYQRVTSAAQATTSGSGPSPSLEEDSIQQACSPALKASLASLHACCLPRCL